MDILTDFSDIQGRIAQLRGGLGLMPAPQPVAGGAFATLVNAAMGPIAQPAAGAMQWPVAGTVTSPFGERKNPLGAGDDFHPGIDIAAEAGTPIQAAAAGRVISAGPEGGYGNAIVVDDGNGVTTRYAHCSQIFVRAGDVVNVGESIGAVGSTGRSTGPHLHFEVRVGDQPVNPDTFLTR